MNLTDFYLVCFLVGVVLSVLTFILGNLNLHIHLPFHMHLPGMGHAPHVHLPHGGHASAVNADLPFINFGTITAFLAWFGGVGYLLSRHSNMMAFLALLLSFLAGVGGATIVFLLVSKLLMKHDRPLNPMDYDMIGVLGRVTSTIREDGVGEIVFSQEGTRRGSGARSDTGREIPRNVEVVVTKYERGIAYVRPWDELNNSHEDASAANLGQ
jgi:membrane protein implicated in regulation of membrane protease activity